MASAIDRPHLAHPGRTDTPNASSARSARMPDHVLIPGEAICRQILRAYADYYNRIRIHLRLEGRPLGRPVQAIGSPHQFHSADSITNMSGWLKW